MPIVVVSGPRDAGPGERERMLVAAASYLAEEPVVRIDVPAKGTAGEGEGRLRDAVHPIVPALQSGSLFGGASQVLVVDAHRLLRPEAEVIAELVGQASPDVTAVFVAAGAIPAPLGATLASVAETVTIKKFRERDAADWLARAAKDRGLRIDPAAAAILLQRFGTDVAAMARALDQLAVESTHIDVTMVRDRFMNRPDEPVWLLWDALASGKEDEALRRLEDYLEHGHPLALLAFFEGEIRRRALAQAAPDLETYAAWLGESPKRYPVRKAWDARGRIRTTNLAKALDALARADLTLKTAPEEVHRVTMERLTVALARWAGR